MRRFSDEMLVEAVSQSFTMSSVLIKLGYPPKSGYYPNVKAHINRLGLSTSHFDQRKGTSHAHGQRKQSVVELLNNKLSTTSAIKRRLLRDGILKNECSSCHCGGEWLGKPMSLHLDHINGNRYDNRIENLRILCPNCHSQTETFGSKRFSKPPKVCTDCGVTIKRSSSRCTTCSNRFNCTNKPIHKGTVQRTRKHHNPSTNRCVNCNADITNGSLRCRPCNLVFLSENRIFVIEWPDYTTLVALVEDFGYSEVGRRLGVSDKGVKKHLCKHKPV